MRDKKLESEQIIEGLPFVPFTSNRERLKKVAHKEKLLKMSEKVGNRYGCGKKDDVPTVEDDILTPEAESLVKGAGVEFFQKAWSTQLSQKSGGLHNGYASGNSHRIRSQPTVTVKGGFGEDEMTRCDSRLHSSSDSIIFKKERTKERTFEEGDQSVAMAKVYGPPAKQGTHVSALSASLDNRGHNKGGRGS